MAFTLAEVLITLGIIGVVAAMTLPTLIQKYQRLVLETQLKKTYTTLSQGIQKAMADDGVTSFYDTEFFEACKQSNSDACKQVLIKYFKIIDSSSMKNREYYMSSVEYKKGEYSLKRGPHGKVPDDKYFYSFTDGAQFNLECKHAYVGFYLDYCRIYLDTNGSKGPNTWGLDIYVDLDISETGKLHNGYLERIMENSWKIPW